MDGPLAARVGVALEVIVGAMSLIVGLGSCTSSPPPRSQPSILLVVFDTTRVDAVSAYGGVAHTTPFTDALAAEGLRYTHAYANASWTLPSHVSLFTGLLPSEHGVGWQNVWAPDRLVMLAERLQAAGYETVGVSENPWLSESFNTTQGFEQFTTARGEGDTQAVVSSWLRARPAGRPFFLFVNVTDAHAPYLVRADNPFLPCCVSAAAADVVTQVRRTLCKERPDDEVAILRGLYLGGVADADAKLGEVLELLHDANLERDLVTIVTSDHGEHFGEHNLFDHVVGVGEALIHVPLVVHGLPGVAPAIIDAPVQLADVTPTVLAWTGIPAPADLTGRPLPSLAETPAEARALVSEWRDPANREAGLEPILARAGRFMIAESRQSCGPSDRVFGDMRSLVRYPFKLVWNAGRPPALYDLAADPGELDDLARVRPEIVAALDGELAGHPPSAGPQDVPPPALPSPTLDAIDRLRALGYLDGNR
jgi:arylsulfatase A-like enzyme